MTRIRKIATMLAAYQHQSLASQTLYSNIDNKGIVKFLVKSAEYDRIVKNNLCNGAYKL